MIMALDGKGANLVTLAPAAGVRICTASAVAIVARRWYVVLTKPCQEGRAAEELRKQGFNVILPMVERPLSTRDRNAMLMAVARAAGRKVRGRKPKPAEKPKPRLVPAFRGYLFVEIDLLHDAWGVIRSTSGVRSTEDAGPLLCLSPGIPCAIPARVIERLQVEIVTKGAAADVAQAFEPGDLARVVDGPFASLLGPVLEQDGDEVDVSVAIFGRSTRVRFRLDQVEKP